MDPFVPVLFIIAVSVVILINLLVYGVKSRAADVLKEVETELEKSGEKVLLKDAWANFFGLKSLGWAQVRGNGILVLTDKRVCFYRYYPKKQISIPLESITNLETVKSYLGKSKFSDLVKITYNEDETAFLVRDVSLWIDEINKAKG